MPTPKQIPDTRLTASAQKLVEEINDSKDIGERIEKRQILIEHVVLGVPVNSHREGGLLARFGVLETKFDKASAKLGVLVVAANSATALLTVILDRALLN